MSNRIGKIKKEKKEKFVKVFNNDRNLHNENVILARGLCEDLEQRDKDMKKTYTIPIAKGYKIVTKEKYD